MRYEVQPARMKKLIVIFWAVMACVMSVRAAEEAAPRGLHFAWGGHVGSSIDMSEHNMSSLNIGADFGLRWRWVRFFGVGAEAAAMVSSSYRSYPVYAIFRTDFSNRPRLLFMDLRGGVSLNYFEDNSQYTGAYGSAGMGITLAKGKNFSSHLILSYTYIGKDTCNLGTQQRKCPGVSVATMRLGVSF